MHSPARPVATLSATVIIPAARDGYGPSGKPCWLREHPAGLLVIHHLLSSLDLALVPRVIIATTAAHVQRWLKGDPTSLVAHLKSSGVVPASTEVVVLPIEQETSSAADTVACAIRQCNVEGSIFIKDQDGCFRHRVVPGADYVVGLRLTENCEVENLPSKSFLLTTGALLSNIVEKRVVSDVICVGGYAFQQASGFLESLAAVERIHERVAQNLNIGSSSSSTSAQSAAAQPHRIFLSHLVQYQMLHQGKVFSVELSQTFSDWKSDAAWRRYVQRFRNVEVTIEGVLFSSQDSNDVMGNIGTANWKPVEANIEYLRSLPIDRTHITLRSSRPVADEQKIRALLEASKVPFNNLILSSFSSTTFLVTAYSADGDHTSHPSGVAYNIPESSRQQLGSVLHFPPH
ncbi:Hypothetical protein, putative [Bodo saltans]|uniref:Uncharacterized protein n=1 Tax=Bodo saltans TaxID=75058 RepID=A0A0S4IN03_BODSA|nr:Hypothetical protein, putative [Bodo saltans]|eukprot:CUE75758.1 Hypothetical protein, putative [Bodo saltans]